MKKILTLVLALMLVLSLASCTLLPEEMNAKLEDIKNSILGTDPGPDDGEHVHNFVVIDSKDATCTKAGYEKLACDCGEKQEHELEALGHDMQKVSEIPAKCAQYGSITYKCSRCTKKESEAFKPTGHTWSDEVIEASRLIPCTVEGCVGTKLVDSNGTYDEILTFTFGDEEKAVLAAKHEEMANILATADRYDETLHAYAEEGELYESYEAAYAVYEEYSDLIFEAQGQYTVAMTLYYCDVKNKDLEKTYEDMMEYYTELVGKFYELSQPWYDSMYREFFFYGATEEEINAFLFDSNALADPEYAALKDRNDEIELEFNSLSNPVGSTKVPELYAEMVANNNRIAEILGYDNYLEYAYENIYERDYSYQDVAAFVEYVKEYVVPYYNMIYTKWGSISGYTDADIEDYYSIVSYSFFEDMKANTVFNDYIDMMEMGFSSNPDKVISFSDELNALVLNGNLFRGTYQGAYVTYIADADLPLAYFGEGYDDSTTVAHEFGHYMNEIYNRSEFDQSYDLLETHSQGQEMLYIFFAEDYVSEKAFELVETYQMLNTLNIIMAALQVDTFEQAIYLNSYDGYNSEIIMADGKITADEYDLLYASISEDFGIAKEYRNDEYWRYGMTITSPCYYVSYSVSAINALQIYTDANNKGFDVAKESYLKLFTYTDENPDMITEEVLEYAGLLSYNDEQLYVKLSAFLRSI